MSKDKLLSDEELREKINHRFDSVCTEGHQQSCGEYQTAVDDVMQLITADRKRVALDARIDELEKCCEECGYWHTNGHNSRAMTFSERIAKLTSKESE